MRPQLVLAVLSLLQLSLAIHFYTVPGETKCFYEELEKGTLVVGKFDAYAENNGQYETSPALKLAITVDVSN